MIQIAPPPQPSQLIYHDANCVAASPTEVATQPDPSEPQYASEPGDQAGGGEVRHEPHPRSR
ncbi:MAG: hypothetical protein OXR73_34290, partial [Myxococcales bacterium]|nr:hypothetical protein [Myxococcales bacterium]